MTVLGKETEANIGFYDEPLPPSTLVSVPAFLSNCWRSQVQMAGCPVGLEFPLEVPWGFPV